MGIFSMKNRRWPGAFVLGSAALLLSAGGAEADTLQEAVFHAVQTNPEVLELAADRRAIDYELRQARANYLPTLDYRGSTGPEYTDDPGTRNRAAAGLGKDGDTWLWRTENSLTLTQLLFDGFATDSEVERQQARVDSAAHRVSDSSEIIGLNAVLAYLDVMRWHALVRIAQDNVRAHEQTVADVGQIADAGRGTAADFAQTEARLAQAREALVQTRGSLADAEANYIRFVGRAPVALSRPGLSADAIPANQESAVAIAIQHNPAMHVAQSDIETARAERRATDAPFWPRLDVEVTGQHNKNIDGTRGTDRGLGAFVVMRYNLYSGGQDTARRREAIERISESEQRRGRVERQVAEEARLAWSAMRTSAGRVEELREQVRANEEVASAYREQFIVGRRSLLDLLDSQNELFLTRGDLATQDYTSVFAKHRVLAAMGALLDTLAIPRPSESLPLTGGGMMAPAEEEAEADEGEAAADGEGEAAAEPETETVEAME